MVYDWLEHEGRISFGLTARFEQQRRSVPGVEELSADTEFKRMILTPLATSLDNLKYVTTYFGVQGVDYERATSNTPAAELERIVSQAHESIHTTDAYLEDEAIRATDLLALAFESEHDIDDPNHPMEIALPASIALFRLRAVGLYLGTHGTDQIHEALNLQKRAGNLTEAYAGRANYFSRRSSEIHRMIDKNDHAFQQVWNKT